MEHTGRRHALMVGANRAYVRGDEEQLRPILEAWVRSPEAVPGSDLEALRLRFERRIARLEEQLHALAADLAVLKESPLWQLKELVDEAAARGRDIVGDMVKRLRRDIMVATNRLEAMRPPKRFTGPFATHSPACINFSAGSIGSPCWPNQRPSNRVPIRVMTSQGIFGCS